MKFKLDENLPIEASTLLREAGHDSLTVLDQNMGGNADEHIIQICLQERRALITFDLDFADIKTYPPPIITAYLSCAQNNNRDRRFWKRLRN